MRGFIHFLFSCLYVLVAFFGLGPVILADGTFGERILTAFVVLVIFAVLLFLHKYFIKKI